MSRGRALRVAVVAVVAVAVLAAAGVAALPEIVRRVVVSRLAATIDRPVTLAAVELNLFNGRLVLRDLRVSDRDQGPLAAIERLQVRFSPRDLLRGHVRIWDATLQAPALRLVRTGPGEFNVSDLLRRKAAGGAALAVTVERFALRGGAVTIEDRTLAPPRTWRVDALSLDARDLSTRPEAPPGVLTVGAVAAGSPLSVWVGEVRLSPLRFHATVIARDIDASLAALYLPPGSPLTPARGTLDASATIQQDPEAGTRVALDAVFGGVELRGAGQAGTLVSAPAVRVTVDDLRLRGRAIELGRLAVDGGSVTLEDARLAPVRRWQAEGIALEARNLSSARDAAAGTAVFRAVVAGSPVSVWAGNLRLAPLELHGTAIIRNVDFALFRMYVPPDLPVQPERGVVNATLRIDHDDQHGTRLALDAGLSGVEARRPAHFVTAPSVRITAEDIGFDRGAVTVGRVGVGSDRLTIEDRSLQPSRTWLVQNVAVEASHLSSRREDVQGVATARATVAGAAVSAWVTHVRLDPLELRATASLRNLDLALVQLYLPAAVPVQLNRGVVDGALQVDHDDAGGTRLTGDVTLSRVRARGRDAVDWLAVSARSVRLTLADVTRRPDTLDVGRLEVTASGSVVDSRGAGTRFGFQQMRLATEQLAWPIRGPARIELSARLRDGGEVEANGTALLTAPPPTIAFTSELALQLKGVEIAPLAVYVPAAVGFSGRVSAGVTAAIAYGPSLSARVQGTLAGSKLAIVPAGPSSARPVVTIEQLSATGIDATWPGRLSIDGVRVRRSWALIERDREGRFLLRTLLQRAPRAPDSAPSEQPPSGAVPPAGPAPAPAFEFSLGEGIFEEGAATIVDAVVTPPARLDIAGARLTVRDLTWPARGQARLELSSPTPLGGRLEAAGTLDLEPVRLDARATLDRVELSPAQPYLPIEGRVAGRITGDLTLKLALEPLAVQVAGQARLQAFRLRDGDRALVTAGRLEAVGIDVDWPRRVTIEGVRLRRPNLLIERDAQGEIALRRLVTPRWSTAPSAAPPPSAGAPPEPAATAASSPAAPMPPAARPAIEIGTFTIERGSGRFVDQTTTPAYAEELSRLDITVTGLTTVPDRPAHFTGTGVLGGGATFKFQGEGAAGGQTVLDLKFDLANFSLPRANPYLEKFTTWTATRGTLSASAVYTLAGTRVDARHDVVVRGVDVVRSGANDEVERRLGLPLGFLVSLLKDARGEIKLAVPVSGDLATREFSFREAVWGAVRALSIRLLALPFSRVGGLFFSEDSKVQAVAVAPALFEAGSVSLAPAMPQHLDRIAAFLRDTPAVKVRLEPILTQADLEALKRELGTAEAVPDDAVRGLGIRRLEVVRQQLAARGVDVARLGGSARRVPLVEASGAARVEFDLTPSGSGG